ncbi:MAG: hypothetical protein H6Q85_2096 [candidate division NC10 bacterium]|nr:hypothetical protein [candidate division NC10 bacterium]
MTSVAEILCRAMLRAVVPLLWSDARHDQGELR